MINPTTTDTVNSVHSFESATNNCLGLPIDLLKKVFSYLNRQDLLQTALICRDWRLAARVEWIERSFYYIDLFEEHVAPKLPDDLRPEETDAISMTLPREGDLVIDSDLLVGNRPSAFVQTKQFDRHSYWRSFVGIRLLQGAPSQALYANKLSDHHPDFYLKSELLSYTSLQFLKQGDLQSSFEACFEIPNGITFSETKSTICKSLASQDAAAAIDLAFGIRNETFYMPDDTLFRSSTAEALIEEAIHVLLERNDNDLLASTIERLPEGARDKYRSFSRDIAYKLIAIRKAPGLVITKKKWSQEDWQRRYQPVLEAASMIVCDATRWDAIAKIFDKSNLLYNCAAEDQKEILQEISKIVQNAPVDKCQALRSNIAQTFLYKLNDVESCLIVCAQIDCSTPEAGLAMSEIMIPLLLELDSDDVPMDHVEQIAEFIRVLPSSEELAGLSALMEELFQELSEETKSP